MRLYTQAAAAKKLGLSRRSLIGCEEDGLVQPMRLPGGQRRYPESERLRLYGLTTKAKQTGARAGLYSGVSTRRQADAGKLERQTQRLVEYTPAVGYDSVEVYEEITSGLHENRLDCELRHLKRRHPLVRMRSWSRI